MRADNFHEDNWFLFLSELGFTPITPLSQPIQTEDGFDILTEDGFEILTEGF